jgi:hypothetical protein
MKAHRYAYTIFLGPIPDGKCVLHKCDNPSCVNPDHLFTGTAKDNTHDCYAKGRNGWCFGIGEEHGRAKLTESAVQDILRHARPYHPQYSFSAFARKYHVDTSVIQDAFYRRTWKHVT